MLRNLANLTIQTEIIICAGDTMAIIEIRYVRLEIS